MEKEPKPVIFSKKAQQAIKDIREYISQDSYEAADKFLDVLISKVERLGVFLEWGEKKTLCISNR